MGTDNTETKDNEQLLLEMIDYYQDGMQFASLSGQEGMWAQDNLDLSMEQIATFIDAIGHKVAMDVFAHYGREEHGVSDADIEAWVEEHTGSEITVRGWTAVGQQVSAHSFCIGVLFGKKIAEEKARGTSKVE